MEICGSGSGRGVGASCISVGKSSAQVIPNQGKGRRETHETVRISRRTEGIDALKRRRLETRSRVLGLVLIPRRTLILILFLSVPTKIQAEWIPQATQRRRLRCVVGRRMSLAFGRRRSRECACSSTSLRDVMSSSTTRSERAWLDGCVEESKLLGRIGLSSESTC